MSTTCRAIRDRERAALKRRQPADKDRCIPVHFDVHPEDLTSLPDKLHAMARLLRSLANNCDYAADSLP